MKQTYGSVWQELGNLSLTIQPKEVTTMNRGTSEMREIPAHLQREQAQEALLNLTIRELEATTKKLSKVKVTPENAEEILEIHRNVIRINGLLMEVKKL